MNHKTFWDIHEVAGFTATEIAVYFGIQHAGQMGLLQFALWLGINPQTVRKAVKHLELTGAVHIRRGVLSYSGDLLSIQNDKLQKLCTEIVYEKTVQTTEEPQQMPLFEEPKPVKKETQIKRSKGFVPPTVEQVKAHLLALDKAKYPIPSAYHAELVAEHFINFQEMRGWAWGSGSRRTEMKSWKGAATICVGWDSTQRILAQPLPATELKASVSTAPKEPEKQSTEAGQAALEAIFDTSKRLKP